MARHTCSMQHAREHHQCIGPLRGPCLLSCDSLHAERKPQPHRDKGAQGLRCSDQVLRHCGLIIANSRAQSAQEHL